MICDVVAIDVGTSMIKTSRLTQQGPARSRSVAVPTLDGPGVDPEAVWSTCAASVRRLLEESGGGDGVDAVIVTGQGDGLWTLEADGGVAHRAYPWNTALAAEVVREWERDGTIEDHYRRTGTVLWPGTSGALWRWLRSSDPARAARVTSVFTAKDWINYCLSGEIATDVSDATIPFLEPHGRGYDPDAFVRLGCEDLADRVPPLVDVGEQLGSVTVDAARSTGLAAGTPVHMGCIDVVAMARGSGLDEPGSGLAVLGTTAVALSVLSELPGGSEPIGATLCLPEPDRFLRVLGSNAGTSTVEWFLDTAGYTGEQRYDALWRDVAAAMDHDVQMLPYLAGERVPFLAPDATGVFVGLTPQTSRADLARAVVVGITAALRHCLDAAEAVSGDLVLTGGGATSSAWCQLVADVTGRAVIVDQRSDIGALGAVSLIPGTHELAHAGPPVDRPRFEPSTASGALQETYREHLLLVSEFREIWRRRGSR